MSESFTASNGSVITPREDGRLGGAGGILYQREVDALREFFVHQAETDWQAKRDAELGRWRYKKSQCVVYAHAGAGATQEVVNVVDETTGQSGLYGRVDAQHTGYMDVLGNNARLYFDAHPLPEPRPWEDAKPGDVWVLTVDGAEYAWGVGSGVDRGRFIYAGGETNLPKDDPDITAGYPLWVDGKTVNGQEAGA